MATVLLIDDSDLALEITKEMLLTLSHQVLASDNPTEFFRLLQAEPRPDVVIVDAIMPEMSGAEVIQKLQAWPDAALAHTPVIMATALEDQLPPAPGVLLLTKPFGLDELEAVLNFILGL